MNVPIRILQVITSLSVGGAEAMLKKVVLGLPSDQFSNRVLSLTGVGPIGDDLKSAGLMVDALGGRFGLVSPIQALNVRALALIWRPDIIHSWMYHSNVFAHALRSSSPRLRPVALIESVRGALSAPHLQKLSTRFVRRLDARLSGYAETVLYNSSAVAAQHWNIGYSRPNSRIIPNGFNTDEFKPDQSLRQSMRRALDLEGDEVVIGMIARFHPLKGHRHFIDAAALLAGKHPDSRFVLAGLGCDSQNSMLVNWIAGHGLAHRFRLLGPRSDVLDVNNALDIAVCASESESFPNSVGEAMSCAVPCVVTDVGDCAHLIGDTGYVAVPGSSKSLFDAVHRLAAMSAADRTEQGRRARLRIMNLFSLDAIVGQFAGLYRESIAHL